LAENDLKPWRKDVWCISQVDAEYVDRMEAPLALAAARMTTLGDRTAWLAIGA
jgi:hypothetical protein